jgi:hypothetical protein
LGTVPPHTGEAAIRCDFGKSRPPVGAAKMSKGG